VEFKPLKFMNWAVMASHNFPLQQPDKGRFPKIVPAHAEAVRNIAGVTEPQRPVDKRWGPTIVRRSPSPYLFTLRIQFGAIAAMRLVAGSRHPVMWRDFAAWTAFVVVMMTVLFDGVKWAYFRHCDSPWAIALQSALRWIAVYLAQLQLPTPF
jgi:hypothetical protein